MSVLRNCAVHMHLYPVDGRTENYTRAPMIGRGDLMFVEDNGYGLACAGHERLRGGHSSDAAACSACGGGGHRVFPVVRDDHRFAWDSSGVTTTNRVRCFRDKVRIFRKRSRDCAWNIPEQEQIAHSCVILADPEPLLEGADACPALPLRPEPA